MHESDTEQMTASISSDERVGGLPIVEVMCNGAVGSVAQDYCISKKMRSLFKCI